MKLDEASLDDFASVLWSLIQDGPLDELSETEQQLVDCLGIETLAAGLLPLRQPFSGQEPPHDGAGEMHVAALSNENRQRRGAVYTPMDTAMAICAAAKIRWAKRDFARVVDVGAGSGRFMWAAAAHDLAPEMVGVEQDPLAALTLRANLTQWGLGKRSSVVCEDFCEYSLPAAGPTLYVGNPPYVRHHMIPPQQKERYSAACKSMGIAGSKLAGLHAHFLVAIAAQMQDGDCGILLMPSEWMYSGYGSAMRQLLAETLGCVSVDMFAPDAMLFGKSVMTTSCVVAFDNTKRGHSVNVRRIDSPDSLVQPRNASDDIPNSALLEADRWEAPAEKRPFDPPGCFVELGEFCNVHRGISTGRNATWIIDDNDSNLPTHLTAPAVTRAADLFGLPSHALTTEYGLRRLVLLPSDLDQLEDEDRVLAEGFLTQAAAAGADRTSTARGRNPWWSMPVKSPAPLLLTYMSRRSPVFVHNLIGAFHTNVSHGIYPQVPLSFTAMNVLRRSLMHAGDNAPGRVYGGGLRKFEPSDVMRLRVPDPATLHDCAALVGV